MEKELETEIKFYPFTNQFTFSSGKAPRTKVLCFSQETYHRFAMQIGLGLLGHA